MSAVENNTLDRIQREIKESIEREDELRNVYAKKVLNNNNNHRKNGTVSVNSEKPSVVPTTNGASNNSNINGFRRFTQNKATKGVMQKFLRARGKLCLTTIKPAQQQSVWVDPLEPPKVTLIHQQNGKNIRNGYVSAEEKMKKELQEFQHRESELRKERRKSQPDLMAALEQEEKEFFETSNLKPARSMANLLSNSTDDFCDDQSMSSSTMKSARSLASLCDLSDDELVAPGTHSLILQFESLKSEQARS